MTIRYAPLAAPTFISDPTRSNPLSGFASPCGADSGPSPGPSFGGHFRTPSDGPGTFALVDGHVGMPLGAVGRPWRLLWSHSVRWAVRLSSLRLSRRWAARGQCLGMPRANVLPTTDTDATQRSELPTLLDIDGIAVHLGVSVRHIRRLVAERRIPYLKWGHLLRFDPVAIAGWLDDSRVDPVLSTAAGGPAKVAVPESFADRSSRRSRDRDFRLPSGTASRRPSRTGPCAPSLPSTTLPR